MAKAAETVHRSYNEVLAYYYPEQVSRSKKMESGEEIEPNSPESLQELASRLLQNAATKRKK